MNNLFISISTAIEQIDTAVTAKGNEGLIGYVLRKCRLFDLPLYQIDRETNQIKQVHSIISEPIYGYFKEKYPPRPRDTVSDILSLTRAPLMYASKPFELSKYFWRIDEFKNQTHEIFDIADIPAISYQISQDVQELQAQIQDLQQQLQEAQTHIKELESAQNAGVNDELHPYTANNSHTNTALIALNEVIAAHWQDPNNPPKQQFIIAWIIEHYPSIEPSKALWIDKIIRHKDK